MYETRKDSGFAWIILLVSFCITLFVGSVQYLPQLYILEYRDAFDVSNTEAGIPAGIHAGLQALACLPAGVMVDNLGCKISSLIDGTLMTAGVVLSAFAPNIYFLYVSYGIIASIGTAPCFIAPLSIANSYFDKYRGLATSIIMCSFAFQSVTFLPILQLLIHEYGWRGSHAIHSAIVANAIGLSLLFRPFPVIKPDKEERIKLDQKEKDPENVEDHNIEQEFITSNNDPEKPKIKQKFFKQFERLKFSLFTDVSFVLYIIAYLLITYMDDIVNKLIIMLSYDKGIDKIRSTSIVSSMGIASIIARFGFGFLSTRAWVNVTILNGICAIIMALLIIPLNFTSDYIAIFIITCGIGIALAGIFSLKFYVIFIIVGQTNLPVALGWSILFQTISFATCVPVSLRLYDLTNSWSAAIILFSIAGFIGGVLIVVIALLKKQRQIKCCC